MIHRPQVDFLQLFFCHNLCILFCHNFFILFFFLFQTFLSYATRQTPVLTFLGGARSYLTCGPTYLHNLYTILPSGPRTLTHRGVSFDSAVDASLLFLFLANNSLRSGSRSSWMSSHLGTKVPHGFDTKLSPDGAHWS